MSGDRSVLSRAMQKDLLEVLRFLGHSGDELNQVMTAVCTSLYMTIQLGHCGEADVPCDIGAVEARTFYDGRIAAFSAFLNDFLEVVRFQCRAGAEQNLALKVVCTSLSMASQKDHLGAAHSPCDGGTVKGQSLYADRTLMCSAFLKDRLEAVRFLLRLWHKAASGDGR